MDFQKIDTTDDEDELFFEGPDPEPVPVAKPARKRVAKGKAAEIEPPVAEEMPVAPEEDVATPSPIPSPDEAAAEPPAGEPVVIVRGSRAPVIAMALAAVAALFASVGLLVTLRTVTTLDAARQEVAQRQAALAGLPALLAEIEELTRRQQAALARDAATRPADMLTRAELSRQMTDLRSGLSRMQAPGTTALAGMVRAGQAELAARIDDLGERVDAAEHGKAASGAAH